MTFTSIEQFKERAQFFPKGKIIPARILKIVKGNKRHAHCVTFGSDAWALPVNGAYVIACDSTETRCVVRIVLPLKDATLNGSHYGTGGTAWHGNCEISEEDWIKNINTELASRELKK